MLQVMIDVDHLLVASSNLHNLLLLLLLTFMPFLLTIWPPKLVVLMWIAKAISEVLV
jgi:hypothetical protein